MAINPAPMDQCRAKCRCQTGPNQDLAYECDKPCSDGFIFNSDECDCYPDGPICPGINGFLTQRLSSRAGSVSVTTFYPSLPGGIASGGNRVRDGKIQLFNGTGFVNTAETPFKVGDEYLGQTITDVQDILTLADNCSSEALPGASATFEGIYQIRGTCTNTSSPDDLYESLSWVQCPEGGCDTFTGELRGVGLGCAQGGFGGIGIVAAYLDPSGVEIERQIMGGFGSASEYYVYEQRFEYGNVAPEGFSPRLINHGGSAPVVTYPNENSRIGTQRF